LLNALVQQFLKCIQYILIFREAGNIPFFVRILVVVKKHLAALVETGVGGPLCEDGIGPLETVKRSFVGESPLKRLAREAPQVATWA
jgi:hypothetical protein